MNYSSYLICILVLMSLFHFCSPTQNFNHVLCKDIERQALLNFKHGLIDRAARLASWADEEKECCSWAGIVCDNYTGHVHQIHLRGLDYDCHRYEYKKVSKQMLGGELSPSLLHLKQLRHLDLSCNDFGGIHVPSFIGSLGNLRYLNLSSSKFGGIIPPQLGNLSTLQVLSLGSLHDFGIESTRMLNMHWLSSLRLLQYLDMSGRDLSTPFHEPFDWFQVINTLPSLVELHLSNCQLSDIHPHVPSINLTSLSVLDLSLNEFHSNFVPRWIFSITSLVSLDLSWCGFQGSTPSSIDVFRNLTSLKLLHISGNGFMNSSSVLKGLSSSIGSNLISLGIRSCGISSSSLVVLHNLTSLLSLDLSDSQLTKEIPKSLGNLCNLREIDLSVNDFHNISFTSLLQSFFECKSPSLESLFLQSSQFSGHLPVQLGQLIHLVDLNLENNMIVGVIPDSIGQLSSMRLLQFRFNLVSGSVPYSIGGLSSLEILDLSFNRLNGNLHDSLGQLPKLNYLDLSDNQLKGNIPDSLGQLSKLNHLDLSDNQLSGNIPDSLCQLLKLNYLDLSENRLNGSLPDSLGQLPNMDRLDLSRNPLNGSVPDSLGQLSKLSFLDISSNLLTGVVTEAHFAKLTKLKYLDGIGNNLILRPQLANWIPPFQLQFLYLKSWGLGPQFPLWLQSQRELINLDISNTNISAPMPQSFWSSFPNLTFLDMSQNHIQGTLFSIPATLYMLDLSSNKFTGRIPYLSNGSGLYLLDLSNNFFGGSLHHMLCPYDEKRISYLNLGNNNLSGIIPECWVKWTSLLALNLENNNLSGELPTTLGFLSNLRLLNMRRNKLSGRLPTSLTNLKGLLFLQLSRNELARSIPSWLGRELSSLIILELRSNNFDGNIPWELCHLTSIKILDLAHNNIRGPIPRCFNNFTALSQKATHISSRMYYEVSSEELKHFLISETLVMKGREDIYNTILGLVILMDLSSNKLSGHIPSELMALRELRSLNLSRNQLTGRIPENIGDMKSLESFDLSLNKLSGELPISLSTLTSLNNFNVSYNSFTGRIPSSTQLQSLNDSSFIGNNLCGDPLTEPCVVAKPYRPHQEDDGSDGADWGLIISMVVGFVVGFWMIVAPLIISRSWRIAYFRFYTRLRYMAYDVLRKYWFNMFRN